MATIKAARRLFANTPIQRLPLTDIIYRKVFKFGYAEEEAVASFMGIELQVPTRDTTIVPGLIGGFYEKIELEVFSEICHVSKNIVDVGGNIGLYASLADKNAPADAIITVFEPIPENIKYLRANLVRNLADRVEVVEKAVGEKNSSVEIFTAKENIGTHSLSAKNAHNGEKQTVDMIYLDDFLADKKVDLLKVDVEGYDGFVIDGAKQTLEKHHPTLFIEYVPSHLANCDYEPKKLLETLLAVYSDAYAINEPKNLIEKINRADLMKIEGSKNMNLIFSANKDHIKAIEGFMS